MPNRAASDEVDVVLNKSKWGKKKEWSNSEIHKLIEEARTCL